MTHQSPLGPSSNHWVVAVLVIDFDESHGQIVQHVHPNDVVRI